MIRFHNSLSGRVEEFVPIEPGKVRMYNCGPTVYNYIHIGNARTFLVADVLRRVLELDGYEVRQIMNLTDVGHLLEDEAGVEGEDRLEKQSALEKRDAWQIARFYADAFFEDIGKLNMERASEYPRATEHVGLMIEMIRILLAGGYAYKVDGEVYFDLSRFPKYGQLSGNTLEKLEAGARVAVDPRKHSPHDFALWKHDPKHQMKWPSPWSEGFPGWHIECSAMSMHYLGDQLDIHTGGEDNIFPHHECEIAQSESVTGKTFARYWLHVRFLLVDNEKMSKSKGNFFTVRDVLSQGHSPKALRYALLSTHYRQPQNYTQEVLASAASSVKRLQDLVDRLVRHPRRLGDLSPAVEELAARTEKAFLAELSDDLGISTALAAVFELLRQANAMETSGALVATDVDRLLGAMRRFDRVLGVLDFETDAVPDKVLGLVQEREQARRSRDFARSDSLREQIRQLGFVVEDTKQGPRVLPA
jgi:cysteinyl-tRNA synthetase